MQSNAPKDFKVAERWIGDKNLLEGEEAKPIITSMTRTEKGFDIRVLPNRRDSTISIESMHTLLQQLFP